MYTESTPIAPAPPTSPAHMLLKQLTCDGIVRLPPLVDGDALRDMQQAFAARLRRLRWNDTDGYERTDRYRFMVQDVLTLAQGFVDLALHPLVQAILREYVGPGYALCRGEGLAARCRPLTIFTAGTATPGTIRRRSPTACRAR